MSGTVPIFEERVAQWSSPPVDDVGYIPSAELLRLPSKELRKTIATAERNRYQGWRNYENRWRDLLKLDSTHDCHVLDYGCGIGIEALQYARAGNDVTVADISRSNVRLALRVLRLHGFEAGGFQITEGSLVNGIFGTFDVIHCAGVLHHIPNAVEVVREMAKHLIEGGELRLMVYSDYAWRLASSDEPPERVHEHPDFEAYWRRWDAVGGYADWYDCARLERRFGEWFWIEACEYLTMFREYLGAVLRRK